MSDSDIATMDEQLVSYNFEVIVEDFQDSLYFTEVSGIGSETEVAEHKIYNAHSGQDIIIKQPGRLKWNDITLKQGITGSNMDVWTWRELVNGDGRAEAKRNGTITMLDHAGGALAQWDFFNAWPSKVSGPQPKSDSNDIALEEMVLVVEYMERLMV